MPRKCFASRNCDTLLFLACMLVGPWCILVEPECMSECDIMLTVNNCGWTADER